uniref:Uncharacterized protein n=1 Tax=Peronospora matthiolae TaxID=2874970 RepID=A0AAV1TL11_9STRA
MAGARTPSVTLIRPSELLEASPNKSTLETLGFGPREAATGEAGESTSGLEVSTTINFGSVEDGVVGLPNETLRREEERDRESAAKFQGPASDELSSSELSGAGV